MVNLFMGALAMSAVFTSMANTTILLPHDVLTVRDASYAANNVASFAYYVGSNDCTGTPVFQSVLNFTCYGPLYKDMSIMMVNIDEDCQALLRPHPCGSDNTKASILDLTNCWQLSTAATDLDLWVQCGQPKVIQNTLPPPPPHRPRPQQGRPSTVHGSGPGH